MPYTTVEALRSVLAPGGGQDPATASDLSGDELEAAILEAQGEVDAKLAGRYTTPFADPGEDENPAPPTVVTITRDIAAYLATLIHRKQHPLQEDHPIRLRYVRAQALLDAVASGEAGAVDDADASDPVAVTNPYEGELFGLEDFDLGVADQPYSRFP